MGGIFFCNTIAGRFHKHQFIAVVAYRIAELFVGLSINMLKAFEGVSVVSFFFLDGNENVLLRNW